MLNTIDPGVNGIASIDYLEMAHDRNASRVCCFNCNLHQRKRQAKVNLYPRSTVIDKTIHGESRLFRVAYDERVSRIGGRW
jgi:hypothetical protein